VRTVLVTVRSTLRRRPLSVVVVPGLVDADRVGALPDPRLPVVLGATIIGLLAVANLIAYAPARRARRLSTADTLRDE
jgi:hypothetical protein